LIQKGRYIDNTSRLSFIQQTLCSKGIQFVLSTFRVISRSKTTNQLNMKGLHPSQGHNPLLNGRFCHQGAASSLIKIGKGLTAARKLDLP